MYSKMGILSGSTIRKVMGGRGIFVLDEFFSVRLVEYEFLSL